eukprot:COSAG01_NODE_40846_length_459_cov_0.497222_2_plen_24_part_01
MQVWCDLGAAQQRVEQRREAPSHT